MIKVERKYDKEDRVVEATGKCEQCYREIDLLDTDCTGAVDCECGAVYNWAGQRLVPRHQWQEPLDED